MHCMHTSVCICFCAMWSRMISGLLAESQSQSMLAHRVLHVHAEDVKGDVSFSLNDQLSTDCCISWKVKARLEYNDRVKFLLIQRRPARLSQ